MKKIILILVFLSSYIFAWTSVPRSDLPTNNNSSYTVISAQDYIHPQVGDVFKYSGNFYKMVSFSHYNDHDPDQYPDSDYHLHGHYGTPGQSDFQLGFSGSVRYYHDKYDDYYNTSFWYVFNVVSVSSCPTGTVLNSSNSCIIPPAPTCSANSHYDSNTSKCVAAPGYHMDGNVSKPDVTCPPSMKYYYKANPWYQFDIKTCVPDSNISKADCLNIPGASWTDSQFNVPILPNLGCYDKSYYTHNNIAIAVGFNPFSGIATQPDLLGSFISKIFNWGADKVKFAGSKLWSSIVDKFKNTNKTFFNTQADVIDMQVGSDGVSYEVATTPKTPTPPPTTNGWRDVYDNFVNNGWDFPTASGDVSPNVPDLKMNDVKFPTDPNPDAFYNVGDNVGFDDSALVTANSIKDHVVPDLTGHLDAQPLQSFSVPVSVKPDFLRNVAPVDYPATFTLIKTVDRGGGVVEKTFKGVVKLPDNSAVNYKIVKTQNPDGSGVDDVVVSHSVNTKNGVKVFSNNYSNVFDSTGAVTSNVDNSSYVSHTDNSGHVVTTSNNSNSFTSNTSSAIDLTPTNAKLDSINSKLSNISTKIDDMVNYRPADATNAETSLNNFKSASDLFDVNFNNYLDFVNGIKDNITLITTQFTDAKAVLENKPTISQINGQCGFDVTMYSKQFHVDPCAFVVPYRPILSLFFTLFMTFAVLLFAVKYLIVGGKD